MENFTGEQITAITNYLNSEIELEKHLKIAKNGYNPKFTDAVKTTATELKKVFTQDEVDFITNAGYRNDLINAFVKEA